METQGWVKGPDLGHRLFFFLQNLEKSFVFFENAIQILNLRETSSLE